jgi:hypothetical protein
MMTIKISEIEMTTEEARELYKQLGELFEPKLSNLHPSYYRGKPIGPDNIPPLGTLTAGGWS